MKSDVVICSILAAIFISIVGYWIIVIPQNGAPDEFVHFDANAKFIADNLRLPISGVDDLRFLKNCRDNPWGLIPCTNSYNTFPAVNYIVSAISIRFLSGFKDITQQTASRLPNLLWAALLVFSLFFSARNFGLSKIQSLLTTSSICFIPQVVFVFSYLNQDVMGLSVAAWCLYNFSSVTKLLFSKDPPEISKNTKSFILLGFSIGALFSSKYNYFVFAPVIGFYFIWAYLKCAHKKGLFLAVFVALMIAMPWYIRNLILYHDLLGQGFFLKKMAEFHPLGVSRALNASGIEHLLSHDWVYSNFKSFFALFGYMNLVVQSKWYILLMSFVLLFLAGSIFLAGYSKDRFTILSVFGSFGISILVILMSAYHSLVIDFQAQGRYLFPILIATFFSTIVLCRKFPKTITVFLCAWCTVIFALLIISTRLVLRTYI